MAIILQDSIYSNQNQIWLVNIGEFTGGFTVLGSVVGSDYLYHMRPRNNSLGRYLRCTYIPYALVK